MRELLAKTPIVAILRGIQPAEAVAVGTALVDAGIEIVEVPLNSPSPYTSIRSLVRAIGTRALVGAGTVTTVAQVEEVAAVGGKLVVSPSTSPAVISAAKAAGMFSAPGFFTPTEAVTALEAGADALKLFPASMAGPSGLKAMRAILPTDALVLAVGGVGVDDVDAWRAAGADGFGLGSALYRPGASAAQVGEAARRFVAAVRR